LDGGLQPYRLQVNDIDNLNKSGFNPDDPTKILIHGFGGNGQSRVIIDTKNGRQATNFGHVCNPKSYNNFYAYLQR
jgi:predicted esterase